MAKNKTSRKEHTHRVEKAWKIQSKKKLSNVNSKLREKGLNHILLATELYENTEGSTMATPDTIKKFFRGEKVNIDLFKSIAEYLEIDYRWLLRPEEISTAPRDAVSYFLGRDRIKQLSALKAILRTKKIVATSGRGGIGKTELVLKFIEEERKSEQSLFQSGFCYIHAQAGNIALQIESFFLALFEQNRDELRPAPHYMSDKQKVQWYYNNFPRDMPSVLVVFDNVAEYQNIAKYLPIGKAKNAFRVILTTRKQYLPPHIHTIPLREFNEEDAVILLSDLSTDQSCPTEHHEELRLISRLVGYLPLALELIGLHVRKYRGVNSIFENLITQLKDDTGLARVLCKIDDGTGYIDRLVDGDLLDELQKQGLRAVFNITWNDYEKETQGVAYLIALFAPLPVRFSLIQNCFHEYDEYEIASIVYDKLVGQSFLDRDADDAIKYHELIRDFVREKREISPEKGFFENKILSGIGTSIRESSSIPISDNIQLVSHIEYLLEESEGSATISEEMRHDDYCVLHHFLNIFFRENNRKEEKEKWLRKSFERIQGNVLYETIALVFKADSLCREKKFDEASRCIFQAIGDFRSLKNGLMRAKKNQENIRFDTFFNDSILLCAEELLFAYLVAKEIHFAQAKFDEAHHFINLCHNELRKHRLLNQNLHFARICHNRSHIYRMQRMQKDALICARKGIDLASQIYVSSKGRKLNQHEYVVAEALFNCYKEMFRILLDMGNIEKAEYYIQKYIDITTEIGLKQDLEVAMTHVQLGHRYYTMHFLDKAMQHYKRAQPVFEYINGENSYAVVQISCLLRDIYEKKNNYKMAQLHNNRVKNNPHIPKISLFHLKLRFASNPIGDLGDDE